MPDPADYADEDAFMAACVPMMMDEGKPQDQAVAACSSMWDNRGKAASGIRRRDVPKMARAFSRLEIKELSEEQRTISGMASTPTVDRVGDIVEPLGARFAIPLPLMLDHHGSEQVGHVEFAKPNSKGIPFKARIVKFDEPGEVKNLVDKAWHLVKTKLRSFVSIGFRPLEDAVEFMESGGLRYKEWEFLELSLVSIPANLEAVIYEAKSLDLAMKELKALETTCVVGNVDRAMAASGQHEPANRPGASGAKPVNLKLTERTMSRTIAEQIAALEATRAAKSARMEEIMQKSVDDGRSTDEAEQEEFDTAERELEQIDGDLKRFRVLERTNLAKATSVTPGNVKTVEDGAAARGGVGRISIKAPELPKGIRFARMVKCIGIARGSLEGALRVAEGRYGDDQGIVNVLKAAVSAGTTSDATWAGPLVSDEGAVFADFVEFLRPMTILGKFGTGGIPSLRRVPFRVPLGSQTTGGAGYWVGEGQAKPLTRFDFTRTTLEPLKVANITVVTEELLRDAALSAETLLRDQLAEALRAKLDTDFIDPSVAAVASISPAAITNGVTPVASSGVDGDAVRADIKAIMQGFIDADNPPQQGVWIMSASTALALSLMTNELGQSEFPGVSMNGGTFGGLPVIVSEYVTTSGGSPNTRYVWLVNASDIYLADEGGISVDMSREASLQMDNAPTMNVGEMGSPTAPVATSVVSLWQTNSVGFRAERTVNWVKRRTSAVQGLSGVTWG